MSIVITRPGKKPTVNKQIINKPVAIDTPVTPFSVDNFIIGPGLHAGTIDNENIGISGMDGVGLWQLGFYGINNGTLTYVLSNSINDYSTTDNFTEFGYVEKSEFRLGDDVSADSDGVITGSRYIRYRPSVGLEIVGGIITVSSEGAVWVGDDYNNGIGLIDNIPPDGYSGLIATHDGKATVFIDSTTGNVTLGDSTGTSYLTYTETDGLEIIGGNLVLSSGNYVWVGELDLSSGCGITDEYVMPDSSVISGFVAINNGNLTAHIDSDTGNFAFGNNVSDAGLTSTTTKYLRFDGNNLVTQNISIALRGTGYIWLGSTNADNTIDTTGTGVGIWNLGLGALCNGSATFFIDGGSGKFAFGKDVDLVDATTTQGVYFDGDNVYFKNVNISLNNSGYLWVGDETFAGGGVGLAHAVNGYTGFVGIDSTGTVTVNIDDAGNMTLGSETTHQLKYVAADGTLSIDGANISVAHDSYVWVGTVDPANGCGLAGGIPEFPDGFHAYVNSVETVFISAVDGTFTFGKTSGSHISYDGINLNLVGVDLLISSGHYTWVGDADLSNGIGLAENVNGVSGLVVTSGGIVTQYIKSDGTFQLGKSSGSYISFDGTNLDLIDLSDVWVGSADHSSGVGLRNTATESGFYARNAGAQTVFIDANNGSTTLGTISTHQFKFDADTGDITLDGAAIGVNDNAYVWVGATDFSTGCGMIGGVASWVDGFYCGYNGSTTVHISAVDGSFTFGKVSGPHISYSAAGLNLFDSNINITASDGITKTVDISADDGSFKFGTDSHCIEFDGVSALNLTGTNLLLSSGNYVWVGNPDLSSGCGIAENVKGVSGLVATHGDIVTAYISATDGSFKLGDNYYIELTSSGILKLRISDYASDFTATNAPEANATVGAQAGTNVFASSGTVLHDHDIVTNQGTAHDADNYTGNTIAEIFTAADVTGIHTSNNTSHVNGSVTDGGNSYVVSNGDIKLYSSHDIEFYAGAGSSYAGGIYSGLTALVISATSNMGLGLLAGGTNPGIARNCVSLSATEYVTLSAGLYINVGSDIHPISTSVNLGSSSYKFGTLYANYIGASSYKVSTVYATNIGQYNSKVSYVYTNYLGHSSYPTSGIYSAHLKINSNNITVGSSSSYFQLHIYASGSWAAYPCYITQS